MMHTSSRLFATRDVIAVWSLASALALAAPLGLHAQASSAADAPSEMSRMIGLSVAASGGPRDTLGLLIATVTRDGPADRAGITTGSRILAVNGLQVRLAPSDIGRRAAADSALLKFDRALRVTPPGRDVMLRVAGGGLTRLINVPIVDRRTGVVPASVVPASVVPASVVPASVVPASVAVLAPTPAAAADAPAPSDTNGERASTAAAAPVTASQATNQAPPPRPVYTVDPVSATPTPAPAGATPAPAAQSVRETRSVSTLADALGDMQLELRRLAHDSHSLAMSDSLADLDAAVGALRRRMRAMTAETVPTAARTDSVPARATPVAQSSAPSAIPRTVTAPVAPAPVATPAANATKVSAIAAPTRISVAGLELARVSAELAAYLGAQAESGLSVIRASEAWEPMRAGDVIVQVDGAAPDAERLRTLLETHKRISVTLLRRGRSFTVLLGDADAH